MILTFENGETEKVHTTGKSKRFGSIARVAARRLGAIGFAKTLDDLRDPPENQLEISKGNRKGQYSIRIDDRYRVRFKWNGKDAEGVEIVNHQ